MNKQTTKTMKNTAKKTIGLVAAVSGILLATGIVSTITPSTVEAQVSSTNTMNMTTTMDMNSSMNSSMSNDMMKRDLSPRLMAVVQRYSAHFAGLEEDRKMMVQKNLKDAITLLKSREQVPKVMLIVDVLEHLHMAIMSGDEITMTQMNASVNLYITLDSLLKEHVALGLDALRNVYDGTMDAGAAVNALGDNTQDLTDAMTSVFGDDAGEAFDELWTRHIGFFANYATGLANNDMAMQDQAREDLVGYGEDFADFVSGALPVAKADVLAGAEKHAMQLLASLDAYDDGDYDEAYKLQHEGYMHVKGLAMLLTTGIAQQFPDMFMNEDGMGEAALMSGTVTLRQALNGLLKEHVDLGLDALREAHDGARDLDAAVALLDKNTNALADTIGSVYGADAREAFDTIWTDHITFFVNHTMGLKNNDASMVMQAEQDLLDYSQDIADFFSGAIPFVQRSTVVAGSTEHKNLFFDSMIAYDNGDYELAYELQREAHTQIMGIADLLAMGISLQYPIMFGGK